MVTMALGDIFPPEYHLPSGQLRVCELENNLNFKFGI